MKLLPTTAVMICMTMLSVSGISDRKEITIAPEDRVPPPNEPLPELDPEKFPPLEEETPEVPDENLVVGTWGGECVQSLLDSDTGAYYQAKVVFDDDKMEEHFSIYSNDTCTTLAEGQEPQIVLSDYTLGVEVTTYEGAWEIDITREEGQEFLAVVVEDDALSISRVCDQSIGQACFQGTGLSADSRSLDFQDSIKFVKDAP